MKPPRSPRTVRLLDSLEKIYQNESVPAAERLQAATLAARILGKRKPSKPRKKKGTTPALSTPSFSGADLAPAKATPNDILRQFSDLAPARPV